MRQTTRSAATTGEPAVGTEVRYRLLGEAVKGLAGQIEAVTECLLRAVRVVEEAVPCCEESAGRSWQYASWLAERLRAQLAAARSWHEDVSEDHALNPLRLEGALAALRRSVNQASLVLGRADISIATSGPSANAIGGEG